MPGQCSVSIDFYPVPPLLEPLVSTIFLLEVDLPEGGSVRDLLLPEWATLRFFDSPLLRASNRQGVSRSDTCFAMTGPQSQEIHFEITAGRHWGVTLTPLGWACIIGDPAHEFANALIDGEREKVAAAFCQLQPALYGSRRDPESEYARLTDFLGKLEVRQVPDAAQIAEVSHLLLDHQLSTSAEFARRANVCRRTLERICCRRFGFAPKMLLRRRRFMRSLTDFLLDPSLNWIGAIDAVYHDQAHFLRDFRSFMGMKPTDYAAFDKPIMGPVLRAREKFLRDQAASRLRADAA